MGRDLVGWFFGLYEKVMVGNSELERKGDFISWFWWNINWGEIFCYVEIKWVRGVWLRGEVGFI